MKTAALAIATSLILSPALAADSAKVPYPEGYRHWHHVKSMVIEPGHALHATFGGLHHLYANKPAVAGYKTGKFPDGAVIVFDLLEAKSGDHAVTEGARKIAGVMHKDKKKFATTGGWGFEGFKGGIKTERAVGNNAVTACFTCHESEKPNDYVFSRDRD